MAKIYIEEYANLADVGGGEAQVPGKPLGLEPTQQITIGSSSDRNATDFSSSARFLIITADADCQFEVGDSTVTADANSRPLWSGSYREVEIKDSDTRIAVIEKQ